MGRSGSWSRSRASVAARMGAVREVISIITASIAFNMLTKELEPKEFSMLPLNALMNYCITLIRKFSLVYFEFQAQR